MPYVMDVARLGAPSIIGAALLQMRWKALHQALGARWLSARRRSRSRRRRTSGEVGFAVLCERVATPAALFHDPPTVNGGDGLGRLSTL